VCPVVFAGGDKVPAGGGHGYPHRAVFREDVVQEAAMVVVVVGEQEVADLRGQDVLLPGLAR